LIFTVFRFQTGVNLLLQFGNSVSKINFGHFSLNNTSIYHREDTTTMTRNRNSEKSSIPILLLFTTLSLLPSSLCQYDNATICTNASNASAEYAQCLDDIPIYDSCPDPSLCEATDGNNVGLAFGLTIGAGLATTLGALLPFIPLIKRSNTTFLAIGLALAAGVMLYVSFTEILKKSRDNFCCNTPTHYELAATGCFFGGILLTVLLDLLVGVLQRIDCGCGYTSRCSRQHEIQDLDGKDESRHSKSKEKSLSLTRNTKPRINGVVNGLHREFDFMHYHSEEEGHTPMMSSSASDSEITSSSTPTADHLEEGEEPGAQIIVATHHNSETESSADPVPNCSSQRALLCNDTDSTSNSNGSVPFNRTGSVSVSDTESRRYAAVTPDVVSTTLSENTNNYANASVNELFSNSSLLRMNAVIPPETVSENASAVSAVGVGGEEVGVVMADVQSHVSVTVEVGGGGVSGGAGEACDGGEAETMPSKLLRRQSYSEMVEQVRYTYVYSQMCMYIIIV
jgi:hypothetical protein